MNESDLARSGIRFRTIGVARLRNYSIGFTYYSRARKGGVADILYSPGHVVEGVLYEVPDFMRLDMREGAPFIYIRKRVPVQINGVKKWAYTYEVREKAKQFVPPSRDYAEIILKGALKLSNKYQEHMRSLMYSINGS